MTSELELHQSMKEASIQTHPDSRGVKHLQTNKQTNKQPSKTEKKNELNSDNFISTLLNTIEICIICFHVHLHPYPFLIII
jgi:hypothetical protein